LPPPAALDELLRRFFALPEMTIRSTGSGFITDLDGYIVTEDHIVDNAETVTVTVQEKKRYFRPDYRARSQN
jgi:serine protease Do